MIYESLVVIMIISMRHTMMCRMILSGGEGWVTHSGSKYPNANIEDRPAKSCAHLNQNPNIVNLCRYSNKNPTLVFDQLFGGEKTLQKPLSISKFCFCLPIFFTRLRRWCLINLEVLNFRRSPSQKTTSSRKIEIKWLWPSQREREDCKLPQ